jgi:DNA-directed RNA polymerase specialized sigma24 family protein
MPLKLRQIFVQKYIDDKPADEICKEYALTSSNYWVIIHRAKVLLRTCLEKNEIL